ncbi:MAG: ABC transporter permease [Oligoflexales bacterium]|nr:ABC transporter permease [Oligoflexales bacterium]
MHLVPGDPTDAILGEHALAADKLALAESLGLNKPSYVQLYDYLKNALAGDFGKSLILNKPVTTLLLERLGPTFSLAMFAILTALLISIPLGILSAIYARRWIDYSSMFIALLGVAIPNFWLGPMLILLFSVQLNLLPVTDQIGIQSYILPSITLGTALSAILMRMTRNSMLENLKQDYVRTARSKGLLEFDVITKHVLKNAGLPIVTIIGLQFGVLLTGTIITERIFDWPGLGTLMLEALGNRDYPLIQGCVLFFSFIYILVNLITDLCYGFLDPRINYDS